VRLGVFFAENPQNQPGAKVLKIYYVFDEEAENKI